MNEQGKNAVDRICAELAEETPDVVEDVIVRILALHVVSYAHASTLSLNEVFDRIDKRVRAETEVMTAGLEMIISALGSEIEEAKVQIADDPDDFEPTDEELANAKPFAEVFPKLAESIRCHGPEKKKEAEHHSDEGATVNPKDNENETS